jgi:hypothetical protein
MDLEMKPPIPKVRTLYRPRRIPFKTPVERFPSISVISVANEYEILLTDERVPGGLTCMDSRRRFGYWISRVQ